MAFGEAEWWPFLSNFLRRLLCSYDTTSALQDLVTQLTEALDLAGAGVALAHGGELRFITVSPSHLSDLEREQEQNQKGPCADAFEQKELIVVADLQDPTWTRRWPRYCTVARESGVGAVIGVPMQLEGEAIGALNIFASAPRDWSDRDLAIVQLFTDAATVFLLNASSFEKQQRLNEQLQQALDSRIVIEQAKGMIASANDIGVDEAFERLRDYARSHSTSLRTVAEAVVLLDLTV